MHTTFKTSLIGIVLVLMAVASLLTMFSLNQINYIVHGELYDYGLQFSYQWAMPYWVFSGIVFGLSWVNILIAIIATSYVFRKRRERISDSENLSEAGRASNPTSTHGHEEEDEQRRINEFMEPREEGLATLKSIDQQESVERNEQLTETVDVADGSLTLPDTRRTANSE